MILIADSGTTKCDWVVIGKNQKIILKTRTKGINPRLLNMQQINTILNCDKELNHIKDSIKKVLFYGAGCGSDEAKLSLRKVLGTFFSNSRIIVEEDLTAAVYGTTLAPGVVCILGTGSNCCFFDGTNIHIHQSSLGYAVMDEGSGNYFGRQLLRSYFYNLMPLELKNRFQERYDLSHETVLKNLYEIENPSAYLASFASFLIENLSEPFMMTTAKKGINDLFENLLMCYHKELKENPIHFVGSIAYYLQKEISQEALKRNYTVGSFVQRPMDMILKNIDPILRLIA